MSKRTALLLVDAAGCLAFLGVLYAPVRWSVLGRGGALVAVVIVFFTLYEVQL